MANFITMTHGLSMSLLVHGRNSIVSGIYLPPVKGMLRHWWMMSCMFLVVVEWTAKTWAILLHSKYPVCPHIHPPLMSVQLMSSKTNGGTCFKIWAKRRAEDLDMPCLPRARVSLFLVGNRLD